VRLETSLPQPAWETIELTPLVEELIDKYALVGKSMTFEIGPQLDSSHVRIVADRSALARVLSNLLAMRASLGSVES
jgi:hypothetical protein